MTTQLDSFETELLAELRAAVASRAVPDRAPETRRSRRITRRSGLVAAAVAAAAAVVLILPGTLATPAYAVTEGPHGVVEVKVNSLQDAPGLQRALAEHGIKADVQYLGDNKRCSPGRYRHALSVPHSKTSFSVGRDGITARIDRRDVAHGETVVISASRIPNGVSGSVGIAEGSVSACHPIPVAPPPSPR